MKKITFVIFAFLTSLCSFAQLALEDFEGTWTAGQGPAGWSIINVAGPAQTWQQANNTAAQPAYQGVHAAFLNKENVANGTQSEDWLITPQFTVPTNGQLHFFSRLTVNGDQGTTYKLMIGTDPTNTATFTQVINWTELTLNTVQQEYEEKIIDLPAANYGQQRYLAFVMMGDDGDRWLIDNVSVMQLCSPPTNLSASNATTTTAQLSWTDAAGAGSWEIEVVPPGSNPTGVGVPYTGALPYTATGLTATTTYTYYVRSLCSPSGNNSTWAGPFTFNTLTCDPSAQCTYVFNLTDSFGDGWNGNTMTVAQNGITMATLALPSGSAATVNVPLCDGIPFTLFWNSGGTWATEVGISVSNNFGQVIYSKAAGTGTQNTLLYTGAVDCDAPLCLPPSGLTATSITETTASLGWAGTTTGNWEYYLVTAGSAAPTASTTGVVTTTQPVPVTGLTASTGYSYYVRVICDGGTTSTWAGPYSFTTTQIPAQLNFTEDFEGSLSWTLLNGTQTNKWFYGTATSNSPTHSLYITNDAGVSNAYTNNSTSIVHAYRDIAIPAGATDVSFSFDWKNLGETGWDFIRVYAVPTNFVFTPGTMIGTLPTNGIQLGANFVGNSNWTTYSQIFNASAYANGTMRLIFQWRNDGSGGSNPPGAIDNINLTLITCPQPINVAVNNITAGEATVTWTNQGTATSWEVIVLPATDPAPTASSVGTVTTAGSPYTATGLTSGTLYKAYVRAICSDTDKSLWSASANFNTTICDPTDQCTYTFILTDSFGDGWNGNTMSVTQNGIVVGTLNLPSGTGPLTVSVPLCDGIPFSLFWNSGGSFATEVGVSVQNSFSQTLYTHAPGTNQQNTLLYTGDVDCDTPACLPPTGLTATNITATTATLGWGGPTTGSWEVYITTAGSPAPGATETDIIATTTQPFEVDGLTAGTIYNYYVRVVCENGTSTWAGPYTFNTTLCEAVDQCTYTFILTDSFGDGWNGNTMSVTQNGIVVGTLNLPSGSGPLTVNVPVCDGIPFSLFWNAGGSFATEVGISVQNNFAQVLYTHAPGTNQQNSLLYTGDVDCDTPACLPPSGLYANTLTYSATVGWGGPADGNWEVYYTGAGNPAPGATETNVITTLTNPVTIEGLDASTQYDFYVRVICEEGTSIWAGPFTFETQPLCPDPTNVEIHCLDSTSATFTWQAGAGETSWEVAVVTASSPVPTSGTVVTEPVYYVENLTVSTQYTFYVRAVCELIDGYSSWVEMDFTTPVVSAGQAQALCAGILAQPQQSNFGGTVPAYGQVGCLFSTPNPTWYYVTLGGTGEVVLNLTQVNTNGTPIDVDFAAFGPFDSLGEACYQIGNPPNTTYIVDCSYSASATETINVTGNPGDVFALLVTNFNGSQGTTTITQTSGPDVSCVPTVELGPNLVLCDTESHNITATVNNPGESQVYTYTWSMDGEEFTPTVVTTTADSQTITVTEEGSHVYTVVVGMPVPVSPDPVTDTVTIAISHPFSAPSFDAISVCGDGTSAQVDLSGVNPLGTLDPTMYGGGVYASQANANTGSNPIDTSVPFTVSGSGQTLYIAVWDLAVPTCKKVTSLQVNVTNAATATFSYTPSELCTTSDPVTPAVVGSTGGTFSATPEGLAIDAVTGTVTPAESTAGVYEVVYTIAATTTCPEFVSEPVTVTIFEPLSGTVTYAGPYCNTAGVADPVIDAGIAGGTFAGDSGLVIDPATGQIDLTLSTVGEHTITYTPLANGPCGGAAIVAVVVINEAYSADITYGTAPFCTNGGVATPTLTGDSNGEYQVTPAEGLIIDTTTGEITLEGSTPGTYEIVYFIAANGSCSDFTSLPATVVIEPAQVAPVFEYTDSPYCSNEGSALVNTTVPGNADGHFEAPAGIVWVNQVTGEIDLAASTPGTYQITFVTDGSVACSSVTSDPVEIVINELPVISIDYGTSPFCSDAGIASVQLNASGPGSTGGAFTSTPSGVVFVAGTGDIDLAASTPGEYTITYTITPPAGCDVAPATAVVTITAKPNAEFGYSYPAVCDNASTMSPVAVGTATLGTFTVDVAGLNIDSATGIITPAGSTPGTYMVTNTVTAFAGCEGSYTFTVVITPAPVAEFTYGAPAYCVAGDDIPEPTLVGDAGTFTATPTGLAIDAATGIIDLDNSAPGTYTVINTITGTDDCPTVVSTAVTVTVTALPVIAYTEGCDGTQYTLVVALTDDPVYNIDDVAITWQSGSVNGPVIGTGESVVITEGGTYYVTLTPESGAVCPVTQEIVVANTICEVQRGISPNNDGLNDTFDLTGYGVTKLEIFNRYGKEVYSFNGAYTNQWNGKTSGGDELPTGTYFYMLHRNTGENKTGWVYINREVK